ncbi:MAG TPA: carboxypeptidase M32 [Fimbriimonadaceae bacterium]|nr:carboxypeptidase M32 [Fimbriimonadaceae bacterium]HRJ95863.1 carboxypeptidase M32 [Fimbriimonadaceae bacterium]
MSSYDALLTRLADVDALLAASGIMEWDQQTYMPPGGAEARAAHVGILSRLAHETMVADETRALLEKARAEAEPGSDQAALIRVAQRDLDLRTKIPASLVEEKSRLASIAHEEWVRARKESNFKGFQGTLERMFEIVRQEAEYLGYKDHIYDALLDQYEEGATAADCRRMFEDIKAPIVALVKDIVENGKTIDDHLLYGEWSVDRQREFTERIVAKVGYDMKRGRQDTAPHPFCTGWSVGDIRITTRYKDYIGSAIFGSLHEAGHAMYEQGSPSEWDRTPLAGGVSLGVHESQSRLWENIVGRSEAFWRYFLHELEALFPQLAAFSPHTFYRAVNKVEPSFIRVEADEVTYNLHIMVRFEIECDVLTGAMKVADMPDAWNEKYRQYLGITPRKDAEGCLQDVHWSMGSIGYFPTYSMGNLLSYQIWHTLQRDIPNTDELIGKGEFAPIHGWLKEKIYSQGRKYTPKELIQRVTGKPMSAEDYLEGLTAKYRHLYAI